MYLLERSHPHHHNHRDSQLIPRPHPYHRSSPRQHFRLRRFSAFQWDPVATISSSSFIWKTYKESTAKNVCLANGDHVLVLDLHLLIVAMERFRILTTACRVQWGKAAAIDGDGELDPAATRRGDEIPCGADLRLILKISRCYKQLLACAIDQSLSQ